MGAKVAQTKTFYLTAEGKTRLQAELETLSSNLQNIGSRLSRPHPWRKNNFDDADIEITREEMSAINHRMEEVSEILQYSKPINPPKNSQVIDMGCSVEVSTGDKAYNFEIVDSVESYPEKGRISLKSPLGKALKGRSVGEVIEVATPAGRFAYTINNVYA